MKVKRFLDSAEWVRIFIPALIGAVFAFYPSAYQLGNALQEARRAESYQHPALAADRLEQAARAVPWRGDLWEAAGLQALEGEEPAAAIRLLDQARQIDALSDRGWLALGDAYQKNGNSQAALATWEIMSARGTGSKDLFQRLMQSYDGSGNIEKAIQVLQRWAALGPDRGQVLYQLGMHEAILNPDQARQYLSQAEAADASLADKIRTLQTGLNTAGLEKEPAYQLLQIGRSLASTQAWNLAEEAFRRATQARPDYAEAWAFLGEARQHLGKDGLPDLARADRLNPDSVLVQGLQALYWRRQGKPAEAVKNLEKVARLEPKNPTWRLELGNTLAVTGDLNLALQYYQQATVLQPKEALYWRALAEFSANYNVSINDIGLPAARQAVALDPNNPDGLDLMGEIFLKNGDMLSAERFLQRSLQVSPDYAAAHYHLGYLYLQEGKTSVAYQYLSRATQLAPDEPSGQQAKRLIDQYFH